MMSTAGQRLGKLSGHFPEAQQTQRETTVGPLKVGDSLPASRVVVCKEGERAPACVRSLFEKKKGVLFCIPGAFTPACTSRHLPSYLEKLEDLRAKGVEVVACLSVNDPFVVEAFSRHTGVSGRLLMVSDGNADFVKAAGLSFDARKGLMGVRGRRFALVLDNCVVKYVGFDNDAYADAVLGAL
mmetsp:Transcript_20266/g.40596  ORF Transcript_20266/g.40596 Transcript_20266/m.40596 type:complete len:184 (+) Transcript_20266:223-774(+)